MKNELTLRNFQNEVGLARQNGKTVRFIRGPIPHGWISQACCLGGKCANLAWAIWYMHGMEGSPVRLPCRIRNEFGLGRSSTYYALQLMEDAGLICVERGPGRSPRVVMLDDKE